jgi:hypothetical protein
LFLLAAFLEVGFDADDVPFPAEAFEMGMQSVIATLFEFFQFGVDLLDRTERMLKADELGTDFAV